MTQIDAGGILDIAMAGTSATLLARKWESALLVNVVNDTLRRLLDNPNRALWWRCGGVTRVLSRNRLVAKKLQRKSHSATAGEKLAE
jgi:hypothetical protein